jgi:pyrroline-5-carboxylate reductase
MIMAAFYGTLSMETTMIPAVGIIGYGNMGEAVALGLVRNKLAAVHVYQTEGANRNKALKNKRLTVHDTLESLVAASAIVVLAVKPQGIPHLLGQLKPLAKGRSFISVAAGLGSLLFQKELGDQVVRFMPNLAATVGRSVVGVSAGIGCSSEFVDQALAVAKAIGNAILIPERLMSAITGLSGSGIAFVFHFIHALAMGGVREGFAYPQALTLALDTVDGAVQLLKETGEHPAAFESRVCSPAGTTIEGVKALERGGLTDAVMEAVSAASRRAQELGA